MSWLRSTRKTERVPEDSTVHKISEDRLHISRAGGWLTSRFHFAFAGWWDGPGGFGPLRVMNDDLVLADNGFSLHPHRHQEIFSYMLEGFLSHGDTEDNRETLARGDIQHMSAGAGVMHEEFNNDLHTTCRFIQTWITPDPETYDDTEVRYGSLRMKREDRLNKLAHVISPLAPEKGLLAEAAKLRAKIASSAEKSSVAADETASAMAEHTTVVRPLEGGGYGKAPIEFRRDVNVFVSEMEVEKSVEFVLGEGRQAYVLCVEGMMEVMTKVPGSEAEARKLSLLNREAAVFFGPLHVTFSAAGDGVDGEAMRHPVGRGEKGDGVDRGLGIGFVNKTRLKKDKDDVRGVDIYPAAHLMLLEVKKSGPWADYCFE